MSRRSPKGGGGRKWDYGLPGAGQRIRAMTLAKNSDLILRSPPKAGVSKDGHTPRPHGSKRAAKAALLTMEPTPHSP